MSVKPGSSVMINLDSLSARGSPLKAVIYDVEGTRIILSQTSPPILPTPAKIRISISYLLKEGNSTRRLGFSAVISEFHDNYKLVSGERVPALVVEISDKPKDASLRKGFRVRASSHSAISLTVGEKEHAIIDISVSGIRFIQHFSDPAFTPGGKLTCLLIIDDQPYPLQITVIRISEMRVARHISAAFVEAGKDLEAVLGKKILILEREELSRKL